MGTHLKSLKSNLQKIEMLRSTLVRLGGPAKPVFTKRTGRNPYFINPEQQMANGFLPYQKNAFVCWAGLWLYCCGSFNLLACIHRMNHFKKYGGGFGKNKRGENKAIDDNTISSVSCHRI